MMLHFGDITKINGKDAPTVDVIVGGSPCQDLSIAGKRAGLDGERSGLFMEQIRIIKEMRDNDRQLGRTGELVRPRYMVWENVPGAFSSNKGEDFRIVLEETAKICDKNASIPMPKEGKWNKSGCIVADGWSIAWRVLDAQFWGVPQRRRRIALVADFGGQSAPEILFVRKSMSRDIEQSIQKRKRTSTNAKGCTGENDCEPIVTAFSIENHPADSRVDIDESGTVQTLTSRMGTVGGNVPMVMEQVNDCVVAIDRASFNQGKNAQFDIGISENGIIQSILAKGPSAVCYSFDSINSNSMKSHNPHSGCREVEVAKTLDTTNPCPSKNQGGLAVVEKVYTIGNGQVDQADLHEKAGTLNCMHDQKAVLIASVDCRNFTENTDINGTSQAKSNGGTSLNLNNVVRTRHIVRRLTPLECERLQGYPDGWTDIGEFIDSNGKKKKSSDAARYKALGNSIAIPPWKWVMKRISACYERDATLASLFDGIGGFPYIWEQINGKGSCLWASEIEEFPTAVTKVRIGE